VSDELKAKCEAAGVPWDVVQKLIAAVPALIPLVMALIAEGKALMPKILEIWALLSGIFAPPAPADDRIA
jgi:hypothetical protein